MNTIRPETHRLGWIGAGVMGLSMCRRLLAAGFRVTVFTRTQAKADSLIAGGATWGESPAAVAAASDVVFSIVGYPHDVRAVHLGPDGTLGAMRPGGVVVDMTTSQPSLAVELAAAAAEKRAFAIDAPVTGGDVGARNGTLSIMIGGDAATIDALQPCWEVLGKVWIRQGDAGAGQHAKLVNQTLIGGNMVGVCEALLYAHRAGLDLETVLKSVAPGAAGSWSLSNLGPRMIAGDFAPGFYVEHFLKDLRIALDEAARMNLSLPGLALCEQLYRAVAAQGRAASGTQALILALAQLSGFDWQRR